MELGIEPLYSLAGFMIGALVGLTGVGGGSLMTPLLILMFGIYPSTAVGTDLVYACITKSGGTLVHALRGTVLWRVVGLLATGSVPATLITLTWLQHMVATGSAHRVVSLTLALALFATAIALFSKKAITVLYQRHVGEVSSRRTAGMTVLLGAILGVLVTLSSVGAGALGLTTLLLLYPKEPMARLVGSDIAHAVPLTLVAGLGHWYLGAVDWSIVASLLIGSIPGIAAGSLAGGKIHDRVLQLILAATLLLVALRLVYSQL
jgi:hypothetical protein